MKHFLLFAFCLTVWTSSAQSNLYFPPNNSPVWDTLSLSSAGYCQRKVNRLYRYLGRTQTKAFILLKDGKIVLERYFGTFDQDSSWYWASAGKSLTATLVGIAQQENHLSINDVTRQYLGRWTSASFAQEGAITIWHQLTMTTGLDDQVWNNSCTWRSCLQYRAPAGSRWAYHTGPYTRLLDVIEQATGVSANLYLQQKIKSITGMDGIYLNSGFNRLYVSTPRSMARFGLLTLNRGVWNGTPVLSDTSYFRQMTTSSQSLNTIYGYLWWLDNQPTPSRRLLAVGANGQYVVVIPSENLVWIRMGEDNASNTVPLLYGDTIQQYVDDLTCWLPSKSAAAFPEAAEMTLYPNPSTTAQWQLQTSQPMDQAILYNAWGQALFTQSLSPDATIHTLDASALQLPAGLYWWQLTTTTGETQTKRVIYTIP